MYVCVWLYGYICDVAGIAVIGVAIICSWRWESGSRRREGPNNAIIGAINGAV